MVNGSTGIENSLLTARAGQTISGACYKIEQWETGKKGMGISKAN